MQFCDINDFKMTPESPAPNNQATRQGQERPQDSTFSKVQSQDFLVHDLRISFLDLLDKTNIFRSPQAQAQARACELFSGRISKEDLKTRNLLSSLCAEAFSGLP